MNILRSLQQGLSTFFSYVPLLIETVPIPANSPSFERETEPGHRYLVAIYRHYDHFWPHKPTVPPRTEHRDRAWEVLYRQTENGAKQEGND